jgi:predicted nucleotidyltransferase
MADVRVIPFGSHARGTAEPGSDVDVAIVSASFQGKDVFERALMTKDAELDAMERFEVPFDILTLTPEELEGDSLRGQFVRAAAGGPGIT